MIFYQSELSSFVLIKSSFHVLVSKIDFYEVLSLKKWLFDEKISFDLYLFFPSVFVISLNSSDKFEFFVKSISLIVNFSSFFLIC